MSREASLLDVADGKPTAAVVPFWRVIDPGSKIAKKLSCEGDLIAHYRRLEQA